MFLPDFLKRSPVYEEDMFPRHVAVRRSPRAKRMTLRLDAKERVFHLVIPRGVPLRKAQQFALQNQDWMRDRLKTLPKPVTFAHGSTMMLWGKEYKVLVDYDKDLKKTDIALVNNKIVVSTNKKDVHGRIIRFLKKEAKTGLNALSKEKARRIREKVTSVTVRDTKSRWGSCSSEGKLSYSWRLIFAPYEAMDYVVAHEVAHLRHLDHGPDFWRLCERLSDDYETGKRWMHDNAQELMRVKS